MTLLTPFKLTPRGLVHTLVSVVCVVLAFVAGPPHVLGVLTVVALLVRG